MSERACPEVARQHEPSGSEPVRQQYSNAVGGDAEKIHDPVGTLGVVHVHNNNLVTAKCGSISSPADLRAKSHNHHGPKTPFKN